jgi:lipopolysaccharide heptosyltransferase II
MRARGWESARRILCVRLDTIGDVLMTTPAIRALKEASPGRKITLLTSTRGAAVAPLIPEIDETIVYDPPWMKARDGGDGGLPDLLAVERLAAGRFDAAVLFTVFSQSPLPAALMCHLADIPLRLAHCRENPYGLLTAWVRESEPEQHIRHEAQRQLDLVATVGGRAVEQRYSLAIAGADRHTIQGLLAEEVIDPTGRWCVIHPGASAESRRYPAESFAAVIRTLWRNHGWQIVLTGDEGERKLVEEIQNNAGVPAVSLAGRLTLGELAALIDAAPLLISNNTAPVHIASATGTPVVDLYALTNPQHTPWLVPSRVLFHDVPCRNCFRSVCPEGHHACLRGVPPEAVVEAAVELAGESQRGGPSPAVGVITLDAVPERSRA